MKTVFSAVANNLKNVAANTAKANCISKAKSFKALRGDQLAAVGGAGVGPSGGRQNLY